MGPVEIVFLVILVVFAIAGTIRGYGRELGVTTMLLLTLFVLELIDERYRELFNRAASTLVGNDPAGLNSVHALVYAAALIVITYVSYEGETLSFPGKRGNLFFDLGTGLLNGYLFAGSLWHYLHSANWPLLNFQGPFTAFYDTAVRFLPPAIFQWQYLVGLVVVMLIARVWK